MEIVSQILRSRHKVTMGLPQPGTSPSLIRFGHGKLSDVLGLGFSYVEQADHCVGYVLVSSKMAKKIAREIDSFYFTVNTPYIGMLWTAKVIVTDKIGDSNIVFSNEDQSVVLSQSTLISDDGT